MTPELTSLRSGGARVSSGPDSKQDYCTPWPLIFAIEAKFGPLRYDLAATAQNTRTPQFIGEETDSLSDECQWHELSDGWLWLNPPFKNLAPWARKCAEQCDLGAKILLLTAASVDSNWWAEHVHHQAHVYFLRPRVQFEGATAPFMKPLALSVYSREMQDDWYQSWRWK